MAQSNALLTEWGEGGARPQSGSQTTFRGTRNHHYNVVREPSSVCKLRTRQSCFWLKLPRERLGEAAGRKYTVNHGCLSGGITRVCIYSFSFYEHSQYSQGNAGARPLFSQTLCGASFMRHLWTLLADPPAPSRARGEEGKAQRGRVRSKGSS